MGAFENQCREMGLEQVTDMLAEALKAKKQLTQALAETEKAGADIRAKNCALLEQRDALLEAARAINNCIAWSDTAQEWHLLPRLRIQPALDALRSAIESVTAGGGDHG